MGAQVSKTFSKDVTHVVFSNGHLATWKKAKGSEVRLVSVLWVARCYEDGLHVNEELYPALNDESNSVLKSRKHRCMQPRDSPERTPESDKRMKKRLDKMIKDLPPKPHLVTDVSPIIIDEENGIVYSRAMKRSDYMAQRLKEMREKQENLSPTASQQVESCSPPGLKPSLGSTPTVFRLLYDQTDDNSSLCVAENGHSPDKDEERIKLHVTDHGHFELCKEDSHKPCESQHVTSGSIGDDGVFEDYFSLAKHHILHRSLFPSLPAERHMQIPFEMDLVPFKRSCHYTGTAEKIRWRRWWRK
ncbi:hypothetical protein LDENG_00219730 [Lucifuga dentata]|nr:hypothetical protein LDENG_00219730 [Lucifuga dentata]